jgi:phosphohistidine swiveling domain-containing protein
VKKRWVYAFTDALPPEAEASSLLGGKGAGLAELTRVGFAVPPGFTITTEACRWFYEHDGTWPPELEEEVREHMVWLESAAGRTWGAGPNRLLVSVRSGAAVSMPGMMDTVLNVGGGNDAWAELIRCINAVFRSWMSDRAIAYRARHHITDLPGTAVNVQAMFLSQVSGVLFTEDPNQPDARRMVVEASHGLGEAVVTGQVTPDRFLVARDGLKVEHAQNPLNSASTLSETQVIELYTLALRVEQHFGRPQDIEWAWADGEFALLQCRPIRGLDVARETEAVRLEEITRLRVLAGDRRCFWVVHNLGETLAHPTPLTWDIIRHFMSGRGGFGRMYRDLGFRPSRQVCEHGFLELIAGRIYADPQRAAQLFWEGLPLTYDLATLKDNHDALNRLPTRFEPDRVNTRFLVRLPGLVRLLWRASRQQRRRRTDARRRFEQDVLPAYLEYIHAKRTEDLAVLSTPALREELHSRRRRVLDEFGSESLQPGFFGSLAMHELERLLAQALGEPEGQHMTAVLTTALEGDTTVEQNALLAAVVRHEATLDTFLDRFGHRCPGEMELMTPRWRENPEQVQQLVARCSTADKAVRDDSLGGFHAALATLPDVLARAGASALREDIESCLHEARTLLVYRESGKHYLMMGYELIRLVLLELARRWGLGDDLFFLRLDELERFEQQRGELQVELPQRRHRWQVEGRLRLPDLIDSASLDVLGRAASIAKEATQGQWRGIAVSAGMSEGPARIVFYPGDAHELGTGYVLVCPSTDPGWTPLFLDARALVVERGGVLSHGAIVARDFGIPAVVLPEATRLLPEGVPVRVDGNTGVITRLKEAARA